MLSTIPKLADKAFVLGFFLPTLLFVLALSGLFYDAAWGKAVLAAVTDEKGWDKLAYLVLAVWVLSTLLMMINLIELQMLEGYLWPVSAMGFLKRGETQRFTTPDNEFVALDQQWQEAVEAGEAFPDECRKRWQDLRYELTRRFPGGADKLLPTRLGNALHAFEDYPQEIYGADSVVLWPHLSTVLPADLQSGLEDSRSQVNCAVNIAVLAGIFTAVAALRFLFAVHWTAYWSAINSFHGMVATFGRVSVIAFLSMVAAAAISRAAYLFAVELALTWGDLVKAAFDCALPALAEKLGYKLPSTGDLRRQFWSAVSEQLIYRRPVSPEQWHGPAPGPMRVEVQAQGDLANLLLAIQR
jgi:hypothetical protein